MGLFDRAFREGDRFADKISSEDVKIGSVSKGRQDRGSWFSMLNAGFTSKSRMGIAQSYAKGDLSGIGSNIKGFEEQQRSSILGANLGHQLLFREKSPQGAPSVGAAPSQGAGVLQARQDARRRAIESARQRFGISSTITTTPLGLVGQGAQLGQKRLLGA